MDRAGKEPMPNNAGKSQRRRRTFGRNPLDVFAGARLREARRLRGYSQVEIGEALGVSFQAVQKYESGENRISAGRLVQLAAFLQVPLAFFAQDRQGLTDRSASSEVFREDELKLVRAYRALPSDAVRAEFRRFIEVIGRDEHAAASGLNAEDGSVDTSDQTGPSRTD
jgi:transcriptional regulator with XRE-family HTH domain